MSMKLFDDKTAYPEDLWGAVVAFGVAALVFYRHMAPSVMLDGSGIFVTAAYQLGVPHPTGHGLWVLLGYLWSHVIVPFGNPAWRIGTMSVFTGGLLVGMVAYLMIRSTRILLQAMSAARGDARPPVMGAEVCETEWKEPRDLIQQRWIATCVGLSMALLFGFTNGVWYWAGRPEQWIQNTFAFFLVTFCFFHWIVRPERKRVLYVTLFFFGACASDHQTVFVLAGALMVGIFASCAGRSRLARVQAQERAQLAGWRGLLAGFVDFWEVLSMALLCAAAGFLLFAWLRSAGGFSLALLTKQSDGKTAIGLLAAGVMLLAATRWFAQGSVMRVLQGSCSLLTGLSFLFLIPLFASTNPPINWGYASTRDGFLHLITRGQYGQIQQANLLDRFFYQQIWVYFKDFGKAYSWWLMAGCMVAACAFVRLIAWRRCDSRQTTLSWLSFVWVAFAATSIGVVWLLNPQLDRQEREIVSPFLAPASGFCVMLVGYGLAWAVWLLVCSWKRTPLLVLQAGCVALLALPLITYCGNRSGCAQEKDDFGYQFGYRMFHPGGGYPDMEKDAVLYGGTDPGRFVPTYMIFCESRVKPQDRYHDKNLPGDGGPFDRSDVYIITQNALADNTYMCYIRDHYDLSRPTNNVTMLQRARGRDHTYPVEPIRIPTLEDSTKAFQQFVDDWKAGRAPPGAEIKMEGGRVQVTGVQAVMGINGILAKWIFDWNKTNHAFYVEESYVIPWMYPYLRPAGVIMKIENEPLPAPQQDRKLWDEIVARDKAYWDNLTRDFTNREEFARNKDAQRSFSKLRSAIAGLYLWRGMLPEAEYAFRQSLQLCPNSPEGCFRLADLFMNQHRFDDARALMLAYLKFDEYNRNVKGFITQIDNMARDDKRRVELLGKVTKGATHDEVFELIQIYTRMNMQGEMAVLARHLIDDKDVSPKILQQIAQLCGDTHRLDLALDAWNQYLVRMPQDSRGWIELGWTQILLNQTDDACTSWHKAVALGGDDVREKLRKDERFSWLWSQQNVSQSFRDLVAAHPVGARGE